MFDPISVGISTGALAISAGTAWPTLLRPGQLKMTRPTLFYFGPDGGSPGEDDRGGPKVFLRTLLYSTAKQGNLIENMYVTVRKGETRQNFNIWVYREDGRLSRGSGLFVNQDGVALDHHFLLPADGTQFSFDDGDYTVDIYAKLVRASRPHLLASVPIQLPGPVAKEAAKSGGGVFFDWGPDLGRYHAHTRPPRKAEAILPMSAAPPHPTSSLVRQGR